MLNRRDTITAMAGAAATLALPASATAADVPAGTLSNPRASREVQRLYAYLWSVYRTKTLTGQQEQNFTPQGARFELDYIQRVTGEQPALVGFDYIDPNDQVAVNERATAWSRSGGVVSICWHWGAPDIGTGYENSKKDFDVAAALKTGTPANVAMLRDMDHIAGLLAQLRDRRVPVLWRPFHEFSGDWFWWGKHGPKALKALWALMYDRYTRVHGLDNLIWVLGWAGQNVDAAYYPGRSMVDIAGADIYVEDHGNLAPMFGQVKRIVGDSVPICLHENGPVPDPALLGPNADWLWFMTWHTKFLTDRDQNTPEQLKRYYASDRYITKNELPAWMKAPA